MNSTLLTDKVQRITQDVETLKVEIMQRMTSLDTSSLNIPDATGQDEVPDILDLIQGLHTRLSGLEMSLEKNQGDAAIISNLDSEEKRAILLLTNFFQEIGGEFSLESLDVLLSQARNNTCIPQANLEHQDIELDSIQAHKLVDVKGLVCPMPTLHSIKTISKMAKGEILQVDGDDPGCRKMLPSWCKQAGHSYLGEHENLGYRSYFIQKG